MRGEIQTSFLLPAYNEEALIGRAIASICEAAEGGGSGRYEIIVCDNASTDDTAAVARAGGARVVQEPHRQIARARNTAARASSGRHLIWLDADAILVPEVLRATQEALDSGVFCGGGALVEFEGGGLGWHARATVATWNRIARIFRLAAGSYFFALREGWEATGGFNEKMYAGEELGFARALKRWGRARGMRFRVIPRGIPSSARKLHDFTTWEMIRHMAICAWPGNLRRRDRCGLWYKRPGTIEG